MGIRGLNEDGSIGEFLRLNTSIAPTPRAQQDRLGVIGGDLGGYPNGRRPGDDVVDITLQVAMGSLCHQGLGRGDPDPNEFTVTLNGQNVVPPTNSTATGEGVFNLFEGNRLQGVVNHNVQNVFQGNVRLGAPGENGRRVCRDATGPIPVRWDCRLSADEIAALNDGRFYVDLDTLDFPNGEIRGQIVPSSVGIGGCNPSDAPSGLLPLTDGAYTGPFQFDDAFPYLKSPIPGAPNEATTRVANLIDDNLEGTELFEPTDATGACEAVRAHIEEIVGDIILEFACNHNLQNPSSVTITRDGPEGEVLWDFDLDSDPSASPGTLVKLLDGTNYMGSEPLEIFADGFESGDTTAWSTVEGNPSRIGGPLR